MSLMVLSWVVMGASVLLVLLAAIAMCFQVVRRRDALEALKCCQAQLKKSQARLYQQEAEIHELTAGLRAEKAHVEQLQRQVRFAQEESQRLEDGL